MKVLSHKDMKGIIGEENEKRSERSSVRWYRVIFSGVYATSIYVEAYDQEEAESLARDIYNEATCDEFMEATSFELEDTYIEETDV